MVKYFPDDGFLRKKLSSVTPEIKMMKTYSEDEFLQKRYGNVKLFVGPETLVSEMSGKAIILSRLKPLNYMPREIKIDVEHVKDENTYDSYCIRVRAVLRGVEDNLIKGPDMIFVPKNFAEEVDLVNTKIVIKSAIPEFSSEFPELLRVF